MKKKNFIIVLILSLTILFATSSFAKMSKLVPNISALQAYHMLKTQPNTYLIDVRTRFEYQVVGHPVGAYNFPYKFFTADFGIKGKNAKKTRYKKVINKNFVSELKKKFKPTDTLLIICRSGHRSVKAVELLKKDGYFKNIYNVYDGFEGDKFHGKFLEEKSLAKKYSYYYGKRNRVNGWRYYGLPETYKMDPKYIYPPDLEKIK